MHHGALLGLAEMCDQPDPFIFPELPDEAAAALDHFLEDFYNSFQHRYGIQLYRYYRAIEERAARHRPMPSTQLPLQDPPF
jgi:predicted component of type VI protein secretion system